MPDRVDEDGGTGGALAGRTVLVTGGNGGIGLGMAAGCARAGAQVVIWGRSADKNAVAVQELSELGAAHAFVCDVGEPAAVAETFAASLEAAGGRVDAVFANAGTTGDGTPFLDLSLDQWHRVLRTNLDGVFLTLQAAARHMVDRGGGGSLVAVSSTSAIHGAAGNEAYGTSKTALLGLVRALAVGLARHDVRVNALLPGWTLTDLAAPAYASERFRDATTRRTPVRRWAEPAEMGPAAVFLADPTNTFHTGDSVVVDGGYTVF
jgi:NAD(P)-dependent dehydrogenase (short-subunit alcohol dehydrogenase family)